MSIHLGGCFDCDFTHWLYNLKNSYLVFLEFFSYNNINTILIYKKTLKHILKKMLRAFFYKQWHKGVGVAHD
jgi:hypothetical protein